MSEMVTLEPAEMMNAAFIGALRRISALRRQRPEPHGTPDDTWSSDIEAAAAELAVAKFLGLYWRPLATNGDLANLDGDVASYQVRHTKRSDGRLILHREDADERVFVLVRGQMPVFEIVGWILARDGKREEHWQEFTGRPCYFVPESELHEVSDLVYAVKL